MTDHVEQVLAEWKRERPDLDPSPMAVIGRLSRVTRRAGDQLARDFARHGIDAATFDVLATLRRSGSPFSLSPKDLTSSAMVTSSAIAQRLNKLEAQGLVTRSPSDADGRAKQVRLTDRGRHLVDAILPDHLATERAILASMSPERQALLASLLAELDQ
ncbi:MarR family winged helix-turn-helix transcriptional regulator [Arthrobacter zhaoguopingii]|uniref:MarR family winged helix-turn-helix transcriptional regulator n=1 Tax=Arthrobacter zhaoguopingii TaxID=2681491 RepID=UPI001357D3FE|nr:MarR family transcriptional regulator [Arthrobacter zhaoguopingii]